MKIIVGLGNPDGKYKNTYHNVGFNVVDLFAKQNGLKFEKTKCRALLAKGDGYIIAKPQTYMNLSGDSVIELKKYFKAPLSDILVVYDDIDLPKGKLRFRLSGTAGTHRGMRDIVEKVGETPRIRVGVDYDKTIPLIDYVVSDIDEQGKVILSASYQKACELIAQFIKGDLCQDTTISI